MPDNVDITPGTGKTVAADEVGGALHQRVKLSVGADGEAADLDHGQSAMAASLPVVIASDQTDVPITLDGETVPVTDNGGSLTVDGPLTDTELRATDVPVTLDGEAVVLGAGSEAIGKLAANSGVDIGDVDVTSIAAGDNNIGNVDIVSVPVPAAIYYGRKAVAAAGTDEALAASQALLSGVTVKALWANTGYIYVGAEGVAAATGYQLGAGESIFIEVDNLAAVWLDAAVNGEGVSYIAS